MLKKNLIKYRLIEKQIAAVRAGRYEEARCLLELLRTHCLRVGLWDIEAFEAEIIAKACGCRVSYSRNYSGAQITW